MDFFTNGDINYVFRTKPFSRVVGVFGIVMRDRATSTTIFNWVTSDCLVRQLLGRWFFREFFRCLFYLICREKSLHLLQGLDIAVVCDVAFSGASDGCCAVFGGPLIVCFIVKGRQEFYCGLWVDGDGIVGV